MRYVSTIGLALLLAHGALAAPVPIAPDQALGVDWAQGAGPPAEGFGVECVAGATTVGVSVPLSPCQDVKTLAIHAGCTPAVSTWWTPQTPGPWTCKGTAVNQAGSSAPTGPFDFVFVGSPPASVSTLVPVSL